MAPPADTIEFGTSLPKSDRKSMPVVTRVERLSNDAGRRVIEPDHDLTGERGRGRGRRSPCGVDRSGRPVPSP